MPATSQIPLQTVIPGQLISASLWMGEFQNIYNLMTMTGIDDYSSTDAEMQVQTNPFPGGVLSRPTSAAGEIERLRWVLANNVLGVDYWYQAPPFSLSALNDALLDHTHTGDDDGTQIPTGGLVDLAVTAPKLAVDSVETLKIKARNVTGPKIALLSILDEHVNDVSVQKLTGQIVTFQIDNEAITADKVAQSAIGAGLSGGGGDLLAINVDGSTMEINGSDALQIKNGGITLAKLATEVLNRMSPKTIQQSSGSVAVAYGSGALATGSADVNLGTAVDISKAFVVFNGIEVTSAGNSCEIANGEAQLLSGTQVRVRASAKGAFGIAGSATVKVYFTVVEFN